jgi:nucleotide-binding universal stress UspA family protein
VNDHPECRVVVGVCSMPAGLQALRYAADQARDRSATLVAVRTFRASGTGSTWRGIAREGAIATVRAAFDLACGGPLADVETTIVICEGSPGRALVAEVTNCCDLLVIGGSGVRRFGSVRRARTARACARKSLCPIVIVPVPTLARAGSPNRLAREISSDIDRRLF